MLQNLIPALHQDDLDPEAKMRRDVLYTQLRSRTGLAPENIDLSEVDFSVSDDALRAQVAKARGITSAEAIAQIDLDEVTIPSGTARRRMARKAQRAELTRRRKATARFRKVQRARRRVEVPRESGSSLVKQRRALKAALAERRAAEAEVA